MINLRLRSILALLLFAPVAATVVVAQQQLAAGPYSATQAAEGQAAYRTSCAGCHMADLKGQNEAPPLTGSSFMNAWGRRSTRELFTFIQASMPPGNKGSLGQELYVDLVAFILQANGAAAGNQLLTANTEVAIGSVANGQMPPDLLSTRAQQGGVTVTTLSGPRGLTVSGTVENYV